MNSPGEALEEGNEYIWISTSISKRPQRLYELFTSENDHFTKTYLHVLKGIHTQNTTVSVAHVQNLTDKPSENLSTSFVIRSKFSHGKD